MKTSSHFLNLFAVSALSGFASGLYAADTKFVPVPSPVTSEITGVAAGTDRFVAGASDGIVLRSVIGPTTGRLGWEPVPLDGGPRLFSAVAGSLGFLVGAETSTVWKSDEAGQNWTLVSNVMPSRPNSPVRGLGFSEGRTVAVGQPTAFSRSLNAYSANPIWLASNPQGGAFNEVLNSVAVAGLNCVAVGNFGLVRWSVDGGDVWRALPISKPITFYGVAFRSDRFVAVGANSRVATFAIGSNGQLAQLTDTNLLANSQVALNAVATTPSGFIAVGDSGVVFTSPDGIAWNREPEFSEERFLGVSASLTSAGLVRGLIMVVGAGGGTWVSGPVPKAPGIVSPTLSTCADQPNPTFTGTVANPDYETIDWYSGGELVRGDSFTFTPSVSASGVYPYEARTRDRRTGIQSSGATPISLTIYSLPEAPLVANSVRTVGVCDADSVKTEFRVSNVPVGGRVQWWFEGNPIPDATNATYRVSNKTPGQYSYAVQSISAEGCTSAEVTPISLTLTPLPPVPLVGNAVRTVGVCDADSVKTEFRVSNVPVGGGVQWWFEGNPIPDATNATYRVSNKTPGQYSYAVQSISAEGCTSAEVTPISLTLTPLPPVPLVGNAVRTVGVCDADSVKTEFRVSNVPVGGGVQWWFEGNPIPEATNATYRVSNKAPGQYSYAVQSISAEGCTSAEVTPISLTLTPLPPVPLVANAVRTVGVCDADSVKTEFRVSNVPVGGGVQWWFEGNPIPDATNATYRVSNKTPGQYSYAVQSISAEGCTSAEVTPISLTLTPVPSAPEVFNPDRIVSSCVATNLDLATRTFAVGNPMPGLSYVWLNSQRVPLTTNVSYTIPQAEIDELSGQGGVIQLEVVARSLESCDSTPVICRLEIQKEDCDPVLSIQLITPDKVRIDWSGIYILQTAEVLEPVTLWAPAYTNLTAGPVSVTNTVSTKGILFYQLKSYVLQPGN